MHHKHSHHQDFYSLCKSHMNKYVLAETSDGHQFDGVIVDVDAENVILAIPIGPSEMDFYQDSQAANYRQWGYPFGYGYYQYPYGGFYGFPGRRFNRLVLPLAALTALSVLPWF
ncbi:hypothetical protein [Salinibacillus xinjiangensis]|uniref:Phosphatidylinositol kinase n=1 Tax=Salinibacillus xinjiangensis TaxID=1229268 RepID=A0A6G1X7T2_9BACI|nr:hypothetical protein [Salinibacillus xinjiangensis]MRG87063.1 hypothetical protein [Salinibacillus xinjiangensis]